MKIQLTKRADTSSALVLRRSSCIASLLVAFCSPAFGGEAFKPYLEASYAENSNVFSLADTTPVPVGDGSQRSDKILIAVAGLDLNYQIAHQKLYVSAEYGREEYAEFSYLDHDEYRLDSGLNWTLTQLLDGDVRYQQRHEMVPFLDLNTTDLLLETERIGSLAINVALASRWRLESAFLGRLLDSPRPGAPAQQLRETSAGAGLKYVGFANVSAGLEGERIDGSFTELVGAPDLTYTQNTFQFAATYSYDGNTAFNAAAGYTVRNQPGTDEVATITGDFGYTRALTGKTTIDLQLKRAVESYITNANSQIASDASIEIKWQAIRKVGLSIRQIWRKSVFAGQLADDGESDRQDYRRLTELHLSWEPLQWVAVRPYYTYENRTSNAAIYAFDAAVIGVDLNVTMR